MGLFSPTRAGRAAEVTAETYLRALGYRLLERGWRSRGGEMDLVMKDGDTVVFVEVRSRSSRLFGLPEETVGPVKRGRLVRTAWAYVTAKRLDAPARFDVVAVEPDCIRHLRDAFGAEGDGLRWGGR